MRALSKKPPLLYLIATIEQGDPSGERAALIAKAVRELAGPERLTLLFQLRDKEATAKALFETATAWVPALAAHQAYLLINERADVAITTGAAGVHVGTGSYSLKDARRILPEGLLAYSAHSPREAQQAAHAGADLVTLSPIFASPGKGSPLGMGPLDEAARNCPETPILALGGIGKEKASAALAAGASGVALIRSVFSAADPVKAACEIALELMGGAG